MTENILEEKLLTGHQKNLIRFFHIYNETIKEIILENPQIRADEIMLTAITSLSDLIHEMASDGKKASVLIDTAIQYGKDLHERRKNNTN